MFWHKKFKRELTARKHMRFLIEDLKEWDKFCEKNFKSRRVLAKVIKEAMEQYIKNF